MNFEHIVIAREAITDKHGAQKPTQNIQDSIDCPICKTGELNYRISSYNGHIHAKCTTDECVCWME
ncbi:hypothetical protein [Acinetobacter dispersus]|uniref:hypothetical protein n=1 Tax=Acinetobacter dispersus TaxID=70348 RepID=UPI00132E7C0F|nr:hypothetical protein [Acinetobacter dispersus]QHH99207.1 hypothetical protein FPL17_17330 [Acinetobacter dispersus]